MGVNILFDGVRTREYPYDRSAVGSFIACAGGNRRL